MTPGGLGCPQKRGRIIRNPADAVDAPKQSKTEIKIATPEAIGALLRAAHGTPYYMPIYIAAATGMRRGEVLGLQWSDFDVAQSALTVRRALCYVPPGNVFTKEPKNRRARVVPIPRDLVDALVEHHKARPGTLFICTLEDGHVITPGALDEAFRRIRKRAKVSVSLHGLRHSQATLLINAGIPVKVVSERLGHSTVQITQDIYTHVMPHMQQQAVSVIEEMLKDARR